MLIVDFDLKIGHMWKQKEGSDRITEEYFLYYSPNALFAICDKEKNLISFAADEAHLKNMLGKSKGYHDNVFEDFAFSFTLFDSPWFWKHGDERLAKLFKTITKIFTTGKITNYFSLTYVNAKEN